MKINEDLIFFAKVLFKICAWLFLVFMIVGLVVKLCFWFPGTNRKDAPFIEVVFFLPFLFYGLPILNYFSILVLRKIEEKQRATLIVKFLLKFVACFMLPFMTVYCGMLIELWSLFRCSLLPGWCFWILLLIGQIMILLMFLLLILLCVFTYKKIKKTLRKIK